MTVGELIERLEEYDEDRVVRLAYQPSWPLQSHLKHVAEAESKDGEPIVYLVDGGQVYDTPYAPREVFDY